MSRPHGFFFSFVCFLFCPVCWDPSQTGLTTVCGGSFAADCALCRQQRGKEGRRGQGDTAQRPTAWLVPYLVRVARSRWSLGREEGERDGRTVTR